MTEHEAVEVVKRQRTALKINRGMEVASAEKAVVEYMKDRSKPGRIEDRVAWVVTLANSAGFACVHVDNGTGEILEVLKTA